MKKGFTLIELLAVIVIIAIIGSIGIYSVTKIINKSRTNSLTDTAFGVRKAASLYAAQNTIPNNSDVILDLTPADSSGNNAGEHANLMSLTKDPWNGYYKSVIAEISKVNYKISYNIYFNTSHGCYVLNNDDQIIKSGDCFSNVTKVFTGLSNFGGLNRDTNIRQLVRNKNGDLHMLIQQAKVANHLVSKDNGKTWQSATAFVLDKSVSGTMVHNLAIDNNNRLHTMVYDIRPYANASLKHYFKDNNGDWQLGQKLGDTDTTDAITWWDYGISSNNQLELIYASPDKSLRSRIFDGTNWTDFVDQASNDIVNGLDSIRPKIIKNGNDVYYFYNSMYDMSFFRRMRINNVWQPSTRIVNRMVWEMHSEIIDTDNMLWIFYVGFRQIVAYKFDTNTNQVVGSSIIDTTTTNFNGITTTLDGNGNIYVAYSINNASNIPSELVYKVFNKTTNTWSTRKQITTEAVDGLCSKPSFKYQRYFNNMPNIVELLYEQKDVGGSTTNLYYTTIKTLK